MRKIKKIKNGGNEKIENFDDEKTKQAFKKMLQLFIMLTKNHRIRSKSTENTRIYSVKVVDSISLNTF